ncbi:SDR family oxidoreductase [Pectobacterium polaris]|uniref:SDR family oxidoreductase n=1 Tax=Pectobacterium polaris TaxID=2042057 RepID=UPI000F8F5311|nr:NAD(P)H-binding protein [Pectobacterium polaris]RUS00781.1 NAD(P)H azoreductase [Pectobacterium polaris]
MTPIKKIAVIGATGRLGAPVTAELAKSFQVRAIVRSPDKAKAMLSPHIEIAQGNLQDVNSLRAALDGIDAIYLNLATETANLGLPFYEEREGVKNLMTAIQGLNIRYIAKIGALGAYPPALEGLKHNMVPNIIRMEGHKIIADSGIAHTFFAPTHFMELLPNMIDKHALQWIGNTKIKIYWISVVDYAQQVVKAFENPESIPEHCAVQGPEAISVRQAMKRFVENYDPTLKIRIAPLWVMKIIGFFNPKMKFVAHLFEYFGNHEDPFYAEQTWQKLGKPKTTLEMFAKKLRQKNQTVKA